MVLNGSVCYRVTDKVRKKKGINQNKVAYPTYPTFKKALYLLQESGQIYDVAEWFFSGYRYFVVLY